MKRKNPYVDNALSSVVSTRSDLSNTSSLQEMSELMRLTDYFDFEAIRRFALYVTLLESSFPSNSGE